MPLTLVVAARTVNAGVVVAVATVSAAVELETVVTVPVVGVVHARPVDWALLAVNTLPLVPTVRLASVVAALAAIMSPLVYEARLVPPRATARVPLVRLVALRHSVLTSSIAACTLLLPTSGVDAKLTCDAAIAPAPADTSISTNDGLVVL